MVTKKQKTQHKGPSDTNPIEAFRELGVDLADTLKSDVVDGATRDIWEQFFGGVGAKSEQQGGDLANGQEVTLFQQTQTKQIERAPQLDIDPGIDYRRNILHSREKATMVETRELSQQVQEILVELKKLIDTSAVLEAQFKHVTMETAPVSVGKYHTTFFEWLLTMIRQARMKVQDSGAWLAALSSKKSKKGYWGMFKKHGTTFGLSNERTVSTQTG